MYKVEQGSFLIMILLFSMPYQSIGHLCNIIIRNISGLG